MLSSLALGLIDVYQRRLSPHKGFDCAYGAITGGLSCSAAVADLIARQGLLGALPGVVQQFADCGRVARQAGTRVNGVCCCGPIPIPFGWGR